MTTSKKLMELYFCRLSSILRTVGIPDFEDGSRTATTMEVSNDLQCVRTKSVVKLAEPLGRAKTMGAVYLLGGC